MQLYKCSLKNSLLSLTIIPPTAKDHLSETPKSIKPSFVLSGLSKKLQKYYRPLLLTLLVPRVDSLLLGML